MITTLLFLFSMSSSATTLHCNTILRRVLHGVRNEQLENIIANEPNIPDGANVPMYMRRQIGADFYIVHRILLDAENFWRAEFFRRGWPFRELKYTVYDGEVVTGCGKINKSGGPRYCFFDDTLYLDRNFINEWFGGSIPGSFLAYVLSHEIGHHLQNIFNVGFRAANQLSLQELKKRLERQADCLSGIFLADLYHAQKIGMPELARVFNGIHRISVDSNVNKISQMGVNILMLIRETLSLGGPDIHGLSDDRQAWFLQGFLSRDPKGCETFPNIADFGPNSWTPPPGFSRLLPSLTSRLLR